MDQLTELFESIIDFVLGNIGIVVFAIFLLSGLFRGGKKPQQETTASPQRQQRTEAERDTRPLAERLAEAFGVEIPEEQPMQRSEPSRERYAPEGRRSTTRRNVQENYPQIFGGSSLFDHREEEEEENSKWGFDETEWGSTFEKNDEQWGKTFPDKKSSEPRIEWPG